MFKNIRLMLVILGVMLIFGGPYVIFGVLPDLQTNGLPNAAQANNVYYCGGAALEEIQDYGKKLESEWENQVLDAQLGYSMVTLDFSSVETFVSNQCAAAKEYLKKSESGDPSLYDEINKFKVTQMRTAKKMADASYNEAVSSLEVLVAIKQFEESQPQNDFATYAKCSAQLGRWNFVQFYGQQAIAAYQAQSTPGP